MLMPSYLCTCIHLTGIRLTVSPTLYRFLLGYVFPVMWYYATALYFGNYYHKDPRERAGLAASAIALLIMLDGTDSRRGVYVNGTTNSIIFLGYDKNEVGIL
ncbi:hypothetical protein GIB67_039699 [Kingdonia uniflora]|uniref:Uncharacterized protein n=1 Tax=Kingdonia uniflora TaxID=39325 RepID=A0A7J7MQE4_9MAGN|nr:hypothetical protein GIB67_039699 [Kingdonia uniflora]